MDKKKEFIEKAFENAGKVFNKPPRDQKRIIRLLKLIGEIWIEAQDLRLTQLIGNCFTSGDLYYVEDDKLEAALKKTYRDLLKEKK